MYIVVMGTLELKETLNGHRGRVWNVCWHPKGTCIASCGEDKTIIIWAPQDSKWVIKTILTEGHTRTIREIAWSPCGNYIASASFDATTAVWDKKSGQFECNATLEGHENEVKSVSWSCSAQLLATCSRDKSVWIWEVNDDEYECAAVINAHTQDVKKVRWHPHEEILASASYDNTVKIFKEDPADNDWTCIATLSSHTSTVWSLAWDKTGNRIATCSDDQTVKIWQEYKPGNELGIVTSNNESMWKCVCTLSGYHTRTIYDIDWCKTTGLLVTACGDDIIRIFKEDSDADPHQPTFTMVCSMDTAHTQDVNCVQWNPTVPGQLASASDDGTKTIKHYSTMSGMKLDTIGVPLEKVTDTLKNFANLSLAASWDNVGLLVEPTDTKIVSHILLTNDLTEDVMQEALSLKTDLIITYHPLIFAPMKSVTNRSWKERIVAKCLENKIAVYSPHTTFDSIKGGVNDWLASAFEHVLDTSKPIQVDKSNEDYGMGRLCTLKKVISIEEAVHLIKKRTNLQHVRLARARETGGNISTIALCAGAGASLLKDVPADLYLTGEMLHHDILDAVHRGTSVVLTNHSDSERGFLKTFACTLYDALDKSVKVSVSERDSDPLKTV